MKTYTIFKDNNGIERSFRVYGNRYGLSLEVRSDPDEIIGEYIVENLPIMYRSQLTEKEWIEKAKKIANSF